MDVQWILDRIDKKPGKNRAALARALGVDASQVTRLLKRERQIKLYEVEKIRDFFEDQEEPTGTVSKASPVPPSPPEFNIQAWARDVPVRGIAACGDDGLFEFNAGDIIDYVRRFPRIASIKDIYALYVSGDSMSPWREPGGTVYVHPRQPYFINDYVVVQMKPKKSGEAPGAYIKKLIKKNDREIRLLQYQPHKEISLKASDVLLIHRVLDWSELTQF